MPSAHAFFDRFQSACLEIHESLNMDRAKEAVVVNAADLYGAKGASLMLFDPARHELKVFASHGLSEAYLSKGPVLPEKSLRDTILGQPVVVSDVSRDPGVQYKDAALAEGIGALVGLPIEAGRLLMGSLRLYFAAPRRVPPEELLSMRQLARHVGLALKKNFHFAALRELTLEVHSLPPRYELSESLGRVVRTAAGSVHALGASLWLLQSGGELRLMANHGLSARYLAKGPLSAERSLGEVGAGRPVVLSRVMGDPRVQYPQAAREEGIEAIIGLPVKVGGKVAGTLRFYFPFEFQPDTEELEWMEMLALQVGLALTKDRLLINARENYQEMLEAQDWKVFNS